MHLAHFVCLQWEKQLTNHPADSWSIDRKGVRGLFYNSVLYLSMLGHANLPHLLMIDGPMLQSRVGNPSLMAAFIFFSQLWFSSSYVRSGVTPSHWSGLSCKSGSVAYRCLPWICSSASWAESSCVGTEPSTPQLWIYSAWMKTHSSYFHVPVTHEFIYPDCFMPFPFQHLSSEEGCTTSIKSMKKLSVTPWITGLISNERVNQS